MRKKHREGIRREMRQLRLRSRLSQADAAALCRVHRSDYAKRETGNRGATIDWYIRAIERLGGTVEISVWQNAPRTE